MTMDRTEWLATMMCSCPYCGETVYKTYKSQVFCSKKCRIEFHKEQTKLLRKLGRQVLEQGKGT